MFVSRPKNVSFQQCFWKFKPLTDEILPTLKNVDSKTKKTKVFGKLSTKPFTDKKSLSGQKQNLLIDILEILIWKKWKINVMARKKEQCF